MSEFSDVMRQAKRMCKALKSCRECQMPRKNKEYSCPLCDVNSETGEVEKIERIVMDWAEKHPEPRYPTWREWHEANFPDAVLDVCPARFGPYPFGNCDRCCDYCMDLPIPADIAEKLGIKPIGG